MTVWANTRKSNLNPDWLVSTQRTRRSLLHQLNNALCVHEEDFSLWLLVQCRSMAVQDVCNLGTRQFNMELRQYLTDVLNTTRMVLNFSLLLINWLGWAWQAPAGWETGREPMWCCWHTEPSPFWWPSPQQGGCAPTHLSWCLEAPTVAKRDPAWFSLAFPPILSTEERREDLNLVNLRNFGMSIAWTFFFFFTLVPKKGSGRQ